MVWIQFLFLSLIIIIAGNRLVFNADALSEKLRLSKAWVGVVLLGLITSLPEAITSFWAVIVYEAADLAVGNMLGSNVYNLMILFLLDCFYRQGSFTDRLKATPSNLWPAGFAVFLTVIVMIDICWGLRGWIVSIGHISTGSLLIAVVYVFGIRFLYRLENALPGESVVPKDIRQKSLSQVARNLLICALIVVATSIGLTHVCKEIALVTGWGETLVGSIFLALATSLPEIVVSFSAFKIGSFDMALGNIFGSNMINMFIIFLSGLFFIRGPMLAAVGPGHFLTAIEGLLLTAIATAGIIKKNKVVFFGIGIDTGMMLLVFLTGLFWIYRIQ